MKKVCEGRITSPFGLRHDPIDNLWREHNGVDIAAPIGTPVFSPVDGTVAAVYNHAAGGKTLIIRSACGKLRFGFCHLSGHRVRSGQQVGRGRHIADSGNTGRTTGPHLHFSAKAGGEWDDLDNYAGGGFVDPAPYIVICDE